MTSADDLTLDCQTCLAVNTTACSDCIVTHLLANDDGPIELEPVPSAVGRSGSSDDDLGWAIERFVRAGLVDDPPVFVTEAEFTAPAVPVPSPG